MESRALIVGSNAPLPRACFGVAEWCSRVYSRVYSVKCRVCCVSCSILGGPEVRGDGGMSWPAASVGCPVVADKLLEVSWIHTLPFAEHLALLYFIQCTIYGARCCTTHPWSVSGAKQGHIEKWREGGGTRPYREMEERVHFMWSTNNYQKKVLLRVTDRNRMLLLYLKMQKYAINKRNF